MALNNSVYVKPISSCKELPTAGSTLLVANLEGCGEISKEYTVEFLNNGTAATPIAANATFGFLRLASPNIAGDTLLLKANTKLLVTVAAVQYTITVLKDAFLSFGGSGTRVDFVSGINAIIAPGTNADNKVLVTSEGSVSPKEYYIRVASAIAAGATSASLQLVIPNRGGDQMWLRKGAKIRFSLATNDYITVAENTTIVFGSPTTVPILAAPSAIPGATSAMVPMFELFELISTTDLPFNFNDTLEDNTTHQGGLQFSQLKTNFMIESTLGYNLRCDDEAMARVILPRADDNKQIFAISSQGDINGSGILAYGAVIPSNQSSASAVKSFIKGTVVLNYQAPTAVVTLPSVLSEAELKQYTNDCYQFGLEPRVG